METIETVRHRGHVIRIHPDETPTNPQKDFEPVGTIAHWHRYYDFPGEKIEDRSEWEKEHAGDIFLPLYIYDHSGVILNTTGFACMWDSGQVGYVYCTKQKAVKEFGKSVCTAAVRRQAEAVMRGEIDTYSGYLSGNVYGYTVAGPVCDDSCWGFFGSDFEDNGMLDYAKAEIDACIRGAMKDRLQRVKSLIMARVPLAARESILCRPEMAHPLHSF